MILIADSGGTKTDWRFIKEDKSIIQTQTSGVSPYYQTFVEVLAVFQNELIPQLNEEVTEVYFYGTGCSTPENIKTVANALKTMLPKAQITVNHDLLAAARALCGHEAGIACILGTGSNSSLYDGENVIPNELNLGYVLGDEGSGAYMGKRLIVDFLHKHMPSELYERFKIQFPTNRDEVLENVYHKPNPSRYLASFVKFLKNYIDEPYCYGLVYKSFELFLEKYVLALDNAQHLKVHFTGSIAFYYGNILRQAAHDKGLTTGIILETPIAGLTLYHLDNLKDTV